MTKDIKIPKEKKRKLKKKKKIDKEKSDEEYSVSSEETVAEVRMTFEELIKDVVDQMIDQVSEQLGEKPVKKTYNLRNKGNPDKLHNEVILIDHRLVFTYSSPYFKGNIDITEYDRSRLSHGCMLNDTLINFYLEYLYTTYIQSQHPKECESQQILNRFLVVNTFFYSRILRHMDTKSDDEIAKLMKWSKGVDFFDKEFVLIPIFSGSHWSLVVLCYPNMLLQYIQQGKVVNDVDYKAVKKAASTSTSSEIGFYPCILVLNSMKHAATVVSRKIRSFLTVAMHQRDPSIQLPVCFYNLPLFMPTVTQQLNSVDCGVYILLFAEKLFQHYGEYSLSANIHGKTKIINSIFKFLQFPASLAGEMRGRLKALIMEIERSQLTVISDSSDSDIECIRLDMAEKRKSVKRKRKNTDKPVKLNDSSVNR